MQFRNLLAGCLIGCGVMVLAAPASARLFSCNLGDPAPKPDWIGKMPSQSGFYFAVGVAEKEGRGLQEMLKAAEANARSSLAKSISVTIRSENEQKIQDNGRGAQAEQSTRISEVAEEELRGVKQRGYWVDQESCIVHVLLMISTDSIAQTRKEKQARQRIERVKLLLANGTDRARFRDIKTRMQYLEEAQSLLPDVEFNLLENEARREVYARRISEAMEQARNDVSRVSERMALVAMNREGVKDSVINRLMDALRESDRTSDRLLAECHTELDCKSLASDRGFSKLALINVKSSIGTSQMGALKGVLSISRTIVDIRQDKILKEDNATAQVIGWSNEELDWNAAVDKAVQGLK